MNAPRSTSEAGADLNTEAVWMLLGGKLRSFIRARVENDATAQDLLQETFLRVHEKLDGIREEDRLAPWVFQIARRLIIDHYRGQGRSMPPFPEPSTASDEGCNLNDQVALWIPAAVQGLPENYREAVRLYEFEGLSQQEIADRLGISLSGAKSRIQRGRRKLKEMLEACCAFEIDRRGNVLGWTRQSPGHCRNCGAKQEC